MKVIDYKKTPIEGLRMATHSFSNDISPRYDFFFSEGVTIVYLQKGTISFSYKGEDDVISEGEALYLSPHSFSSLNGLVNSSTALFFLIDPNKFPSLASLFFSRSLPFYHLLATSERRKRMQDDVSFLASNIMDKRPSSLIQNESRLLDFFALLSKETEKLAQGVKKSQGYLKVLSMMEFISKDLSKGHSLEEIASAVNLRKHEANRLFKEETGASPIQYANEQRLLQAATALSENRHLSFAEASRRFGFVSPSYFGELFKRSFGMTPGEFLEKNSITKWTTNPTKALEDYFTHNG